MIAPIEEHRAHAYETKFAMLISTSVIQVVPDHITLINFEFSHPYSYYNVKLFLFHACRCVQMFISSIHEIENGGAFNKIGLQMRSIARHFRF